MAEQWTLSELYAQLGMYEIELRAAGLAPNTVLTYSDRAERFLNWLAGSYRPGG